MPFAQIRFSAHAARRLQQRGISEEDVHAALRYGDIIRHYPEDKPLPSYLLLAWIEERPLHVVAADDASRQETRVVTAYEPDPLRWQPDFRTRRP